MLALGSSRSASAQFGQSHCERLEYLPFCVAFLTPPFVVAFVFSGELFPFGLETDEVPDEDEPDEFNCFASDLAEAADMFSFVKW